MTAPLDTWFKSSYSNSGANNCVEVRVTSRAVLVRHSTRPDGTLLSFSSEAWSAFVRDTASGRFTA